MKAVIYIIKKLGILIALLIASAVVVIVDARPFFGYELMRSYLIFAVFVLVSGILMHVVGERIPRRFSADHGIFRCFAWEDDGRFYQRVFRVSRWKNGMFDASQVFSDTKDKSQGVGRDPVKIHESIQEMCVAETVHWILIMLGFMLLLLIPSAWKWLFWILYVLFNLSDIVIQRYNRPRLEKVYLRLKGRKA